MDVKLELGRKRQIEFDLDRAVLSPRLGAGVQGNDDLAFSHVFSNRLVMLGFEHWQDVVTALMWASSS